MTRQTSAEQTASFPSSSSSRSPQRGFLESNLLKLFANRVTVAEAETVARDFRLIRLEGPACQGLEWRPGHKIQMQLSGWNRRSYTPTLWDARRGHVGLVAYLPGKGPGSHWAQTVVPGEPCLFTGPGRSLNLGGEPGPVLLFGDETSLGLAYALTRRVSKLSNVFIVLEAHQAAALQEAVRAVGLPASTVVIQRCPHGTHLQDVVLHLSELWQRLEGLRHVLSGQAQSIQHVTQALRRNGVPTSRIQTRAYWSQGKRGLE